MKKKFSENLSDFLDFCREVNVNYKAYKNEVDKAWDATQDCLHQLEFGKYDDRAKTATMIANIRKARRYYKDNIEIMEEMYNFLQTPEFLKFHKQATEVLGRTRKVEKSKENKMYSIKVLKNVPYMQDTFNNDTNVVEENS